jgi:hypothetical protein
MIRGEHRNTPVTEDSLDQQGRLEEYKALRAEILQWQNQRMRVLSLSITAMAGILALFGGALLNSSGNDQSRISLLSIVGSLALYVILIPLEMLLISSHRQVRRIGEYIRVYIESAVPGLQYESRLLKDRDQPKPRYGIRSLGKVCIGLSIVPLVLPVIPTVVFNTTNWTSYLVLLPFLALSLYLAFDLWFAFSSHWKKEHWTKRNNGT